VNRSELKAAFLAAPDRESWLRDHSSLPGPRSNLELLDVAAAESSRADLARWAAFGPQVAPENTPAVFLACVGTVGFGYLVAAGDRSFLPALRRSSRDARWRVREAVAMALQAWGDADTAALVDEMERWASGPPLEGRAALAALCEPRLLRDAGTIARTIAILDRLTASVRDGAGSAPDRRVLRQALGYGWSVAVAADVSAGLTAFERWVTDPNEDVRWIVRQNLGKARLVRLAPDWVGRVQALLAAR
jgi:hypothetical protein